MSSATAAQVSPGFASPHYTMVPDDLFDVYLAELSGAELKVLLYITRHTLGWNKHVDRLSLTQLCKGITRRDGTPQDHGTGLHRETACQAIKSLERRGLITVRRAHGPHGHETTVYALRFDGETSWSDKPTKVVGSSDTTWSDQPTILVGSDPTDLVGSSDPQETSKQETDGQQNNDQRAAPAAEDAEARRTWGTALEELKLQMSRPNFETWFKDTQLINLDLERRTAVIAAPSAHTETWLRTRCVPLVEKTLRGIIGKKVTCAFTVQCPAPERQTQQALL